MTMALVITLSNIVCHDRVCAPDTQGETHENTFEAAHHMRSCNHGRSISFPSYGFTIRFRRFKR